MEQLKNDWIFICDECNSQFQETERREKFETNECPNCSHDKFMIRNND